MLQVLGKVIVGSKSSVNDSLAALQSWTVEHRSDHAKGVAGLGISARLMIKAPHQPLDVGDLPSASGDMKGCGARWSPHPAAHAFFLRLTKHHLHIDIELCRVWGLGCRDCSHTIRQAHKGKMFKA